MKRRRETPRHCLSGLWSVRMRASAGTSGPGLIHISGAEGLYTSSDLKRVLDAYFERALTHPRGKPDTVVLTVEKVTKPPRSVPLLSVTTLQCDSPRAARNVIRNLLGDLGISVKAIEQALGILNGRVAMRGASLIRSESGERVEPDMRRGVRVSRLGIERESKQLLSRKLARLGINTQTVKEALILASKAASCKGVIAEVCISDDPDYTTGYVATRERGYARIPCIKREGSLSGGRVFFVDERADVKRVVRYLEETPVLVAFKSPM